MVRNPFILSERDQYLLKVLVERYIQSGQPVGSRLLARDSGLKLSPATIRNIMADLEDYGLIAAPHTSAGRIPTVGGYRLFIDNLLTVKPLEHEEISQFKYGFKSKEDAGDLLETASKMLSDLTQMVGIVTLPKWETVALRHIEFLPLSHGRVLVILVTNEQEVQNHVIHPSRQFTSSELQQAANYLNSVFWGKDLKAIRKKVLREMQDMHERMNQEMVKVIEMAYLAFEHSNPREDYVLSGETNLMDFSELADMDNLRQLFEAFSQKRDLIHLLDQCLQSKGVQIFIGEESGYGALDNCSLVTSSYGVDGEIVGVLGVIGPTRMKYERVIPLVDITAKLLGAALNEKSLPPS